jgi:hypothetical protein
VNQDELGIRNAVIRSNIPAPPNVVGRTVQLRQRSDVIVGRVLFTDFTLLPGRVRFVLGENEIDMMPRALLIDGTEVPWASAMQAPITLRAHER